MYFVLKNKILYTHACRNFHGLNFRGVKFSWLKPPTKIGCHENFATLTVCSMERWMCGYQVYNDIWVAAIGETLISERESRNAHDRYTAAGGNYSWWAKFSWI